MKKKFKFRKQRKVIPSSSSFKERLLKKLSSLNEKKLRKYRYNYIKKASSGIYSGYKI